MIYFGEKHNPTTLGNYISRTRWGTIGRASVLGGFHLLTQGSGHLIDVVKMEEKWCDEVMFNLYVQGNEAGIFNI
jgi:hypothetical protein